MERVFANDLSMSCIIEWLKNKKILVTGGTGFMGKVLVEKLLRCSELEKIYVVLRPKRGESPKDRWTRILKEPMFEPLLSNHAETLKKVTIVEGNMSEINFGISEEMQEELAKNVNIVFHVAASVRFDDPLCAALLTNTRGTLEVARLAAKMDNLECLEYVSTTYCNCHLEVPVYMEQVYPPAQDWRTLLKLAQQEDPRVLNTLLGKILNGHPNTYTLSKNLAEQIMEEYSKQYPVVIFRPSVVIGCLKEPVPGWSDNLNGVLGVTCGTCKGVLRVIKGNPDTSLDYVSADFAINGMIVAAWDKAIQKTLEISVYNCAYANFLTVTFDQLAQWGLDVNRTITMDNSLWYPFIVVTNNTLYFYTLFYTLHLLPALLIDSILFLLRKDPMLMRIYIKIFLAGNALSSFTEKNLLFDNSNYMNLWNKISIEDKKVFFCDPKDFEGTELRELMEIIHHGCKKYIFKEKDSDLPAIQAKYWRFYYLDRCVRIFLAGGASWLIGSKMFELYTDYFKETLFG